jgi:hypothetical protein
MKFKKKVNTEHYSTLAGTTFCHGTSQLLKSYFAPVKWLAGASCFIATIKREREKTILIIY